MFGKEDRYNTQGFAEFMEVTHAITDWKINSKVILRTFQQHVKRLG